jgi:hypothetical protein
MCEDQTRRKSAAPEPYQGKWRNLWLCIDGTSFWGEEKETEQDCLEAIAAWLDGAREIENKVNGLTTCVFYGDVIPTDAPLIRRRILNYTVIPILV